MTALIWFGIIYSTDLIFADPVEVEFRWEGRRLLNSTDYVAEKSIFEKIKEFYDDPNNLAMWGVLPMIILVYGGFCVIYCVCKGYDDCKKKKNKKSTKKKRLLDDDDEIVTANSSGENINNNNNINNNKNTKKPENMRNDPRGPTRAAAAISARPSNGKQAASTTDVKLAVENENATPLPWAVPDENPYPTKPQNQPHPNQYPTKPQNQPHPAPAGEAPNANPTPAKPVIKPLSYKAPNRKPHPDMHMPPSPPPPYDDYGRRDSIEEISMKPRKVNTVSNRSNDPRKAMNAMNAMEQYALARQAAQLLRVDNNQPGQPGYKKPKRLVFVAE